MVLKDGFLENIKPNSVLLFLRNLFCGVNTAHFQAQVFNEIRCLSFFFTRWLSKKSPLTWLQSMSPLQSKDSAVCMLRIFQVLFQKILINCGQHTNNSLWQKLQTLSNFVVGNCHLFCFITYSSYFLCCVWYFNFRYDKKCSWLSLLCVSNS